MLVFHFSTNLLSTVVEMASKSMRAAVIGAGMAGLVAARELRLEHHNVVVFEKNDRIGGTWVYDPRTETDPMSVDPTREIVHSSMYHSLRTNLPRPLMDFLDYAFNPIEDPRSFPGHEEVLRFLNDFADSFELIGLIRFGSEVIRVEQVISGEWVVEWWTLGAAASTCEVFDAVVVCNGHNTQPRVIEFPGRSTWPGKQVHSHNYRTPDPYKDQIVLIIGNGPTALDVSNDILPFAKQVHQSFRGNPNRPKVKSSAAILQHPMIKCAQEDGKLVFEDGSFIYADVILHCTGYIYHFPFLRTNDIVTVDDNRVGPLYKHVFPPSLAPSLSFIGLTYQPTVGLVIELQSKWVARVLSGKILLPNEEQMMESVQQHYKKMEQMGWPKHHSHRVFQLEDKFGYQNWLTDILGLPREKWREDMVSTFFTLLAKHGLNCRDQWDDNQQVQQLEN